MVAADAASQKKAPKLHPSKKRKKKAPKPKSKSKKKKPQAQAQAPPPAKANNNQGQNQNKNKRKKSGVSETKSPKRKKAKNDGNNTQLSSSSSPQAESQSSSSSSRKERILREETDLRNDDMTPWHQQSNASSTADLIHRNIDLAQARVLGKKLYEANTKRRLDKMARIMSEEQKFMEQVMASGTISDKISALALTIRQRARYRLDLIWQLIKMAEKKVKRESLLAIEALKDLWTSSLLPDRKLRAINNYKQFRRNNTLDEIREQDLIDMYFEDALKSCFGAFLDCVERGTHDSQEWFRIKMLKIAFELLSAKPEGEQILLALLVNKLGDSNAKVASSVVQQLTELSKMHPAMKRCIADEVHRLLRRQNLTGRAQYYSVIFLNQMVFQRGQDSDLAAKLIAIYFDMFQASLQNNASAKGDKPQSSKKNSKLLPALLTGVNRAFVYAPAAGHEAYDAQVNELFKLVHTAAFSARIQALMLLFQVGSTGNTPVSDRFYRALYDVLFADDLAQATSKQALFFNLVFKALKADRNIERQAAFIKRMLQCCHHAKPTFVCSSLFLISRLLDANKDLHAFFAQPDQPTTDDSSEDTTPPLSYDPVKRDPQHANSSASCYWEVEKLLGHFHPSVMNFAEQVLQCTPVVFKGDPLTDFTSLRFLDRFVYRNPKKAKEQKTNMRGKGQRGDATPVNTAAFLRRSEDQVPQDQLFFHKFFQNKQSKEVETPFELPPDKEAEEAEVDEFTQQLFAEEMERMLGKADVDDDDELMDAYSDGPDSDSDDADDQDEDAELAQFDDLQQQQEHALEVDDVFGEDSDEGLLESDADSDSQDEEDLDGDDSDAEGPRIPKHLQALADNPDKDNPFATADEFAAILEMSQATDKNRDHHDEQDEVKVVTAGRRKQRGGGGKKRRKKHQH